MILLFLLCFVVAVVGGIGWYLKNKTTSDIGPSAPTPTPAPAPTSASTQVDAKAPPTHVLRDAPAPAPAPVVTQAPSITYYEIEGCHRSAGRVHTACNSHEACVAFGSRFQGFVDTNGNGDCWIMLTTHAPDSDYIQSMRNRSRGEAGPRITQMDETPKRRGDYESFEYK